MSDIFGLAVIVVAVAQASTPTVAQSVPVKPVTIQSLNVPGDRLPAGCSLKVIEPASPNPRYHASTNPMGMGRYVCPMRHLLQEVRREVSRQVTVRRVSAAQCFLSVIWTLPEKLITPSFALSKVASSAVIVTPI